METIKLDFCLKRSHATNREQIQRLEAQADVLALIKVSIATRSLVLEYLSCKNVYAGCLSYLARSIQHVPRECGHVTLG